MRRRHVTALAAGAVVALVGAGVYLSGDDDQQTQAASVETAIPQLPERDITPTIDAAAVTALDDCIADETCTLVHTRAFSNATIEVFQQETTPPAVHVRTVFADDSPTVWNLKDEHAATFKSMTCGLANCLLDVVVGPEMTATIDMRMVSNQLTGKIEGAAVRPSLATQAADLNKDGVLDLIATEHLIHADGTELTYYRTYVNDDRTLIATGCSLPSDTTIAPTKLQARTCPTH